MKKILAAILAAASLLSMCGCSEETKQEVEKFIEAEGREYGKTYTAYIGEAQENTFFSTVVNEVAFKDTVGDYYSEDENLDFACVNVTVENITKDTIPMACYDFYIRWGTGEDQLANASYAADLADDVYGEMFDLESGKDYTATLYFLVPKDSHDNLQLVYEEYYDDDFVGSTYIINLD